MRAIPMQSWPRKEHFEVYRRFAQPHFGMCANMDVTSFYPFVREHGYSFTVAVIYLVARIANAIPEFHYRIHGEEVIEHEIVHPSATILVAGDLFSYCTVSYSADFSIFSARAAQQIAYVKEHPTLKDEPVQDNLLFMTAIPWVSFTSFMHPVASPSIDSVPRFAWGKRFEESGRLKMPLAAQVHHALMDGIHMGRFYNAFQQLLDQPELLLDEQNVEGSF